VIYYTDKTGTRVDVFYDMITRKLLGYREALREFVDIKKTNKKIKINYSIYNKLKLLGYTGEYINIDQDYKSVKNHYIEKSNIHPIVQSNIQSNVQPSTEDSGNVTDETTNALTQQMYREIVKDISRIRIDNLKQTILEFQRIFNRIINGYVEIKDKNSDTSLYENKSFYEPEITDYFANKLNSLVDRYRKKLKNVATKDANNKHGVFKYWKGIVNGIFVENFDDKYFNFDSDLIEADNISRYDSQSNLLLYYIIHEFTNLLNYNNENFMKTNICNMLVEFIDRIFTKYNTENLHVNNDIKKFMYVLHSIGYLKETEEQTKTETPQGFYEEYVDIDEEPNEEDVERKIDDEEEQEAIDVDMDEEDIDEGFVSQTDRQAEVDEKYEELLYES
jgi:hypothetical protein